MAKNLPKPREKSSQCSHSKVIRESGPHVFEGINQPVYKWKCSTTKGCKYWFWGTKDGGKV